MMVYLMNFLKTSSKLLIAVTMLFNIVLQTGKIPHAWCICYISPVYKRKDKVNDPDNYRGITVLFWPRMCVFKISRILF